jgi:hypothetical protein
MRVSIALLLLVCPDVLLAFNGCTATVDYVFRLSTLGPCQAEV